MERRELSRRRLLVGDTDHWVRRVLCPKYSSSIWRARDWMGLDDTRWHALGRDEHHFGVFVRSVAAGALEGPLEVALQDAEQQEALTGVRASDLRLRAVSMVAGVGFEPTTFGL